MVTFALVVVKVILRPFGSPVAKWLATQKLLAIGHKRFKFGTQNLLATEHKRLKFGLPVTAD